MSGQLSLPWRGNTYQSYQPQDFVGIQALYKRRGIYGIWDMAVVGKS